MLQNTPAFSSFSAPDLVQMKDFYGTTLGLPVSETPEGLHVALHGGLQVFIYPSTTYHAPEHTVLNFIVEDIDAAVKELNTAGVSMEQYPDFYTDKMGICRNDGTHPGPKAIAWFKDPAEHILSLIQEK